MKEFDYIVVGGGSAGAVLAARLSQTQRVLLLEAGGGNDHVLTRMPAGVLAILISRRWFQWPDSTEPQEFLHDRRLYYPRGRVLGGGSSMNGAMWVRGNPADYDRWGVPGWCYRDLLPYFIRSESWRGGTSALRGSSGPIAVTRSASDNELSLAFMRACASLGYPPNADFNGEFLEGAGAYDFSIADGVRSSTADAYLKPLSASASGRLTICTRAQATKILFDGSTATGVEAQVGGKRQRFYAGREVILCCGAIGTPQLLMLSGIGDAAALRRIGVDPLHHSPEVGQNLKDHLQLSVQVSCLKPVTLYSMMNPLSAAGALMQWTMRKTGAATNIGVDGGVFLRSSPDGEVDIQVNFMRANLFDHGRRRMREHGFMAHACHVRPASKGHVGLRSADPLSAPLIQPRFLSHPGDRRALRNGVKAIRRIFGSAEMAPYTGTEFVPGARAVTDEQIDAVIRTAAECVWHPVGTCRMGTDEASVVDAQLRVRGVERLRVIDASVMPDIPSGNTNAPTIMIAEKASDLIISHPVS